MRRGTYQALEIATLFGGAAVILRILNHKNQPGINHPCAMVTGGWRGQAMGIAVSQNFCFARINCGHRVTVLRNEEL
jgi:hypothetical protein